MAPGRIQPTTGPVVGLAAKFSAQRWEIVSKVRSPARNTQQGDYGYWFNYFWEEAVTARDIGIADKSKLCETLYAVFEADVGNSWKFRQDFARRDDYWKLKMLRNLLHIGFQRAPYLPGPKSKNKSFAGDASVLFTEKMAISNAVNATELAIGWRGDGRDFATLQEHGGFKARARQDQIRAAYGLDKPWHPYSLQVYRNSIFLRKGHNVDNCLHTAVSVGTDFKMLVHFPIVTDYSLYALPTGPIDSWKGNEAATLKQKYKINIGRDQHGSYLEHDTQIYAVWITTHVRGFHTENFQTQNNSPTFPERSVQEIPVENILARVVVTRRYWWDTQEHDPRKHGWQLFDAVPRETDIVGRERLERLGGAKAVAAMEAHARQKLSEASQREDIAGDRAKRIRILTQPRGNPQTQANAGLQCTLCDHKARNGMFLKQHMQMKHGID